MSHDANLPENAEAERSVLRTLLVSPERYADVREIVAPEDFYVRSHQLIFAALGVLADDPQGVDIITLEETLRASGDLDAAGGRPYLAEIVSQFVTGNVESHAGLVRDCSLRRKLLRAADEIRVSAIEGPKRAAELVDEASGILFDLGLQGSKRDTVRVGDVLIETYQKLMSDEGTSGGLTGVDTGYYRLNDMLGGFQSGDLVIIAARPSMGKTTFALNCALNACLGAGKRVLFFSIEMAEEPILTNMLCATARVDAQRVRKRQMTRTEQDKISEAAGRLMEAPFLIDTTSGLTPMDVRAKARRAQHRHGKIDLILIDYLQMMQSHVKVETRQLEVAHISRSLKELAKEFGCPVIALSQLNRALEGRKEHRPQLSDLRESGAIEQDADVIMFLHREDYYGAPEAAPPIESGRKTEVIIGKQRNGPTGKVDLLFFPNLLRFENLAEGVG